ncbi:MAG: dTMP kinase, partial [Candidatus Pacearchaeota archaeon]|nr:dTMP kinase [Candidatus Pacearchaeota archaeon]
MKTSSYPGRFIAFDGLDGSGQSTQVALLRDFLSGKGIEVITTKEPTSDSSVAGRIRIVLDGEEALDSLELQRLFAKDREEHLISIVIPALEKGIWVITDRYALTSFAFSEAGGLNLKEVVGWHEDVLSPDITFFLRVSPVVAVRRLEARGR